MPYCPQCRSEYVEGVTFCEDCQTPLQASLPPEQGAGAEGLELLRDVKLVAIRTFNGPTALLDAEVARNILKSQNIPSIVSGENSVELLPVLDVPLLVREEDAIEAAEILKSYLDSPGAVPME
jgi:putative signal transducing protein